ncbi:CBN-HLH-26 protein [Caenorhabditis brenneri]|uniref:CBN-HLH-26 protein n=1 Tax=Caenorhabditis brenneri TaxID=135651 RepID=G0NUD8_CAEBE|nr:CBN-HLH-26 protein [Caenorhabditis brenneri]
MDSVTLKARKVELERKRTSDLSNAVGKMKQILITKGIKSETELSSQVDILLAVVEWICLEDLHKQFSPIVFKGTETLRERNTQKGRQRYGKVCAAFAKMKEFLLDGGNNGKWTKQTIRRVDILDIFLQLMEIKSSNASQPVLPMNTKALPNASNASVNFQSSIQPPVAQMLKHSIDSILQCQKVASPQSVFFQQMYQFYLQYYCNIAMHNVLVQNQVLDPMANKENGSGSGIAFLNTSEKY